MMRLIGLYREAECSPGRHRSNDAQLLELVGQALESRGFRVELMTLSEAARSRRSATMVFSMCQGRGALDQLMRWELEGTRLINSPRAALNTYRDRLPAILQAAGLRFPPTTIVTTARVDDPAIDVNGGLWLKRGDVHASVSADVQWADTADALRAGLREFASRGITHAALQAHRCGDEIKFYGIAAGPFFHWFYPDDPSAADRRRGDRAGDARRNGNGRSPVDVGALRRLGERAAAAAGLEVFGGDVIVGPSGELTLIDLNDWPSFAPCRDRAADAIAEYLMRRVDAAWNPGVVSSANESAV
jgi:hypothetical protein